MQQQTYLRLAPCPTLSGIRLSFCAQAYGSSSDMKEDPKVGGPRPADELPAKLLLSLESVLPMLLTASMPAAAAAAAMAAGGMLLMEGD